MGVLVVENTSVGGRQPYGLAGSLEAAVFCICSSDAGGEGTVPGIKDE